MLLLLTVCQRCCCQESQLKEVKNPNPFMTSNFLFFPLLLNLMLHTHSRTHTHPCTHTHTKVGTLHHSLEHCPNPIILSLEAGILQLVFIFPKQHTALFYNLNSIMLTYQFAISFCHSKLCFALVYTFKYRYTLTH